MDLAALIVWLITASYGLSAISTWLAAGGVKRERTSATSRIPPLAPVIHGIFGLTGLGLWIAYMSSDRTLFAWCALGMLPLTAGMGLYMFTRWRRAFRGGRHHVVGEDVQAARSSAEAGLPVPVVLWHVAAALSTVVLVTTAVVRASF